MSLLYGMPQNLAHADDPYQSLLTETAKRNAMALYESMTDSVLAGTVTVTEGHNHSESSNTVLTWMQLGSWRTAEGLDTTDVTTPSATHIDNHVIEVLGYMPLVVPQGRTTIIPRARVATTSNKTMTLTIDYMAPSTLTTVGVAGGTITNGTTNTSNGWIVGSSADVSTIALTGSLRVVYMRVQAQYSSGSHGHLYEVQVAFV